VRAVACQPRDLEKGAVTHPDQGTPQGGVISPLLANVFLHGVLDMWFEREVKPRLQGCAVLTRYADDFVLVFEQEADARRVMAVLPKRFGKHGLTLHPDKTKLVKFTSPGRGRVGKRPVVRPGSFDLLGFTHYWDVSRNGYWVVKVKTMSARFTRSLRSIRAWCRLHMHDPVAEQSKMLSAKVRGHLGYYGVISNSVAISRFVEEVRRIWFKWLSRRSNQNRLTRERFALLVKRYPLPKAHVRWHTLTPTPANPRHRGAGCGNATRLSRRKRLAKILEKGRVALQVDEPEGVLARARWHRDRKHHGHRPAGGHAHAVDRDLTSSWERARGWRSRRPA
jgi:hypothetical protein